MKIIYFAHARKAAGVSEETIEATTTLTTAQLWDLLTEKHKDLVGLRAASRFARGNDFLSSSDLISANDEIAVIPPVSGG